MDSKWTNLFSTTRKKRGLISHNECQYCKENLAEWCLLSMQNKAIRNGRSLKTRTKGFSDWKFSLVLLLCISVGATSAATTVSSNDVTTVSSNDVTTDLTSEEENDGEEGDPTIPKAVITVAGMAVFVLLGISISKLVDYCYDRHAISDDASDISDYTKELLKAQLMLAFSKGKDKKEKLTTDELAKKYAKTWRAKVARNKARALKREKTMAEERGTFRPGSSRTRTTNRPKTPATMNVINEKRARPGSKTKPSTVSPDPGIDVKKGSSRPISAGLKSRPVSARSFRFIPRAGKRS